MTFRSTTVFGSKVNIQSLLGEIDAGQGAVGGGLLTLLRISAMTRRRTAPATATATASAMPAIFPVRPLWMLNAPDPRRRRPARPLASTGGNTFHAFNDPLIMIAGAGAGNNLDVQGASIVGRYRVTLAAEDGNLLTQGAIIDHGEQLA